VHSRKETKNEIIADGLKGIEKLGLVALKVDAFL
jgi:hypothetical protein